MHPDVRTPGSPLPMTPSRARGSAALDFPGLPILLRPALRAYVLGYASAVDPTSATHLTKEEEKASATRGRSEQGIICRWSGSHYTDWSGTAEVSSLLRRTYWWQLTSLGTMALPLPL